MLPIVVLITSGVARAEYSPPDFDKRPYGEAKKAAEDAKNWFIVKATAALVPPVPADESGEKGKGMSRTFCVRNKKGKQKGGHSTFCFIDGGKRGHSE